MPQTLQPDLKGRVLYEVAKAAWEGKLMEQRQELCRLLHQEFSDKVTRRHIANQIRLAMGLMPRDDDNLLTEYDQEALMGTENEPVVIACPEPCPCDSTNRECEKVCSAEAISHDSDGRPRIDYDRCTGEGRCVEACSWGVLSHKSQFVPLIELLRQSSHPVYASVAPAFAGQFGPDVTFGKLRAALRRLGFVEAIETALFADLVTMKEAFEFDRLVRETDDFMLTSCCCPVWIKLVENKHPELMSRMSPSVSPMIASGRVIKTLDPGARVVFIGPCIAKKSEARLPNLCGAIDFVLTFQELATIFSAVNIDPSAMPEEKDASDASWGGRIYGRTGGVSAAVQTALESLIPERAEFFAALQVDGVQECQEVLNAIGTKNLAANFIEGMACKGGCVGGPGRIAPPEQGAAMVNRFGETSPSRSPLDNPHVYSLLTKLGQDPDVRRLRGESPVAALLARQEPPL